MAIKRKPKHAKPAISNGLYDVLKFVAQIVLPALGAAYFGLAEIWGLPKADEVVGTIVVIDTFLGVVLGLSTRSYNNSAAKFDGALVVDTSREDRDVYSIELGADLEDLRNKKELTLKVQNPPASQ